jgi:hypothetical protein
MADWLGRTPSFIEEQPMIHVRLVALPILLCALAACESQAEQQADATEDRIEQQADASALAAGDTVAALGLSEAQLLDADLVSADGTDLGDVEQVRRGANGAVGGLLISIENSDPDRYVVVPVDGLTTRPDGDDIDVQTTMTAQDLAALPDATLDASVAPTPAA